jgi:hypothetical protein
MIPRWGKIALVAGVAFFYALIVFNNLTDPDVNYQFVRHVLRMDSIFPGNRAMWKAIDAPWVHVAFFAGIIAWEFVTTVLLWWGVVRMARARPHGRQISRGGAAGADGAGGLIADVAGGVSVGRRRVVPDVAVADVERPAGGGAELHRGVDGDADCGAAGEGRAGIIWRPRSSWHESRRATAGPSTPFGRRAGQTLLRMTAVVMLRTLGTGH